MSPSFLGFCHPALTPQLTVSEVEEEVGIFLNSDVMMEGVVLAKFEGLKAIDDYFPYWRTVLHHALVEEHAMASNAGDMSVNRRWGDRFIFGNLAVCHASDGLHEDPGIEVWALLPVRSGESLGAEAAFAG